MHIHRNRTILKPSVSLCLCGINLLKAKEKRAVERVMPLLDALRQDAGFWISDVLYHDILMQADE
jgi:predicted nucleic acid-binding protein